MEALIIALVSLLLIGLYGKWWMWWGGFAWGPRFLAPLAPLWVLPLAECLNPRPPQIGPWKRMGRIIIIPAALLSVAVQLLSVLVNYVNYEIRLRDIFPTDWNDPLLLAHPPSNCMIGFIARCWDNFTCCAKTLSPIRIWPGCGQMAPYAGACWPRG
ncbi:MAG: hypothetical protein R2911_00420 [Caldilineaceae bacterium]